MNFRKSLAKKLKKTGGFTLVEMLIVVAIIAILIAISIPMVTSSLDRAKTATDDANERSAKAAALLTYMDPETTHDGGAEYYCYNADAGTASQVESAAACGYTGEDYGQGSLDKDGASRWGHVHVTITPATATEETKTEIGWTGTGD